MVVRVGAAICGAAIMLGVSSAAMARTEIHSAHSHAAEKATAADRASHGDTIVGAASTYNPFQPGWREGGRETSTGEIYNPSAWAAAIQTGLRGKFGGVHAGMKPRYALVERGDKEVIVKINDVGPLVPGRVIDLDQRAMRYFDPSLQLGVIHNVKVIALPGNDWTAGPVEGISPNNKLAGGGRSAANHS